MAHLLVKLQKQRSIINHCPMYRITWYDVDTGTVYETTVDESYNNFAKNGWEYLVNQANPFGAYENLKVSNKTTKLGIPVISADSRPQMIMSLRDETEALEVMEAAARQRGQL